MSDVILYTTEDGKTQIDLHLKDGTVWLSQQQIADLFQTSKQNISKHIKAIYEDQELDERATVNQQLTVQKEGSRDVSRTLTLYNLDVILRPAGLINLFRRVYAELPAPSAFLCAHCDFAVNHHLICGGEQSASCCRCRSAISSLHARLISSSRNLLFS